MRYPWCLSVQLPLHFLQRSRKCEPVEEQSASAAQLQGLSGRSPPIIRGHGAPTEDRGQSVAGGHQWEHCLKHQKLLLRALALRSVGRTPLLPPSNEQVFCLL